MFTALRAVDSRKQKVYLQTILLDITVGLAFTIKGKDAEKTHFSFDQDIDLKELTTAAQILDLINTPDAIHNMSSPNDRIYTTLQAYGAPCQGGPELSRSVQILHTQQIRYAEYRTSRSV